ncbi:hypothetical protein DVH24_004781 [Malus domestica]|uniref:Uncharacterized protein n=1 Tax=Malus domestica TaxID=3750 RepID=A0A498IFW6_MALDO|nr:hypothetical protein DVH24_004781 [Malus domestica]
MEHQIQSILKLKINCITVHKHSMLPILPPVSLYYFKFAIHQNTYRQLESHPQIPLLPASFSSNIKIWLKFPSLFPSARNLTPITQKSHRPSPCVAVFLISRWFVLSTGFHLGTRNTCCMSRFITVLTRIFEIYPNCILSLSALWKGSIRHPYVRRHTKSGIWNGMVMISYL